MITVSTQAWHFKIVKSMATGDDKLPKDLCSYFWTLMFSPVFYLLFGLMMAMVYAIVGIVTILGFLWKGTKKTGLVDQLARIGHTQLWKVVIWIWNHFHWTLKMMIATSPFIAFLALGAWYLPSMQPLLAIAFLWLCIPLIPAFMRLASMTKGLRERKQKPVINALVARRERRQSLLIIWLKDLKQRHCRLIRYD